MLSSTLIPLVFLLFTAVVHAQTYVVYLTSNDPNNPFANIVPVYTGIPADSVLLSDFTISFNQEVDFGGSAPTTGKVTFNTLQVVKPIDFNTPPFLVKMASGKLWTGITLGIYQVSGTAATPVMQYRLGEVAISGISTNSPTGNGLIEVVSFEYAEVIEIYHGTTASGAAASTSGGWDSTTNTQTPAGQSYFSNATSKLSRKRHLPSSSAAE